MSLQSFVRQWPARADQWASVYENSCELASNFPSTRSVYSVSLIWASMAQFFHRMAKWISTVCTSNLWELQTWWLQRKRLRHNSLTSATAHHLTSKKVLAHDHKKASKRDLRRAAVWRKRHLCHLNSQSNWCLAVPSDYIRLYRHSRVRVFSHYGQQLRDPPGSKITHCSLHSSPSHQKRKDDARNARIGIGVRIGIDFHSSCPMLKNSPIIICQKNPLILELK